MWSLPRNGQADTSSTRQERRQAQRDLRKHHKYLLKDGLPASGNFELGTSLALLFCDTMRQDKLPEDITRATRLYHRIFELTDARNPANKLLPCRSGCDFCCYAQVSVVAPEALLIAEQLHGRSDKSPAEAPGQLATVAHTRLELETGLVDGGREAGPCPLLTDRACSVYQVRPLMCRKYSSPSLADCEILFDTGKGQILADAVKHHTGEACLICFMAALKSLGYPHRTYQLRPALQLIAAAENPLARWAAKEDIFSTLPQDGIFSDEIEGLIDSMAAQIS